ncbi:hypothetical protein UFOVP273_10 [uncultured Caudovirales phage]|uniref:Uncharacterized protein n=1 Tax=uncultured Caudovirales phage TaxID=2100421 RepID=A0A6J5LIS9_9CAUD|nr:hypothetical protein UFOVP273_10 [uncultured Caudovirales phage]
MKLIDEWKAAHKMVSMWCMTAASALLGTWELIPKDLQDTLPHGVVVAVTIALLATGMIGRLVKQDGVSGESK